MCCITNLYCVSLEEHPIKQRKKKIPTISMVLKGPHKTTEMATTTQRWVERCDSKEERSKHSNKNRYGHGFIFNTRSETEGFEIQTRDKRTPPIKSKRASVNKLSFIFPRETRRIRKKSQYISFVFTGEMMLYC